MKKLLSLILAILMVASIAACGGRAPQQTQTDPATTGDPTNPIDPSRPVLSQPAPAVNDALPMLPEANRNIPEGSNVIQVGDKWIIAPHVDADYYPDTLHQDVSFYVLSREPMDRESFQITTDQEVPGLRTRTVDNSDHNVFHYLYYGYAGVDWKAYYFWTLAQEDYSSQLLAGKDVTPPNAGQWSDLNALNDASNWFYGNGNPNSYIYQVNLDCHWMQITEEVTVRNLTISWPGAEQTVDVGEIRLHPDSVSEDYDWPWDYGLDYTTGLGGSDGCLFGPNVACCRATDLICDREITITGVTNLNELYPVAEVVIKGTAPGVKDSMELTPDHPVTISAGSHPEIAIYFTGPHLSELNVDGVNYFVIDCEVDGQECHYLFEFDLHVWHPEEDLFAIVMDNVDLQGYYEYLIYAPDRGDETDAFGAVPRQLCDKIGWTEKWEAMMAG